MKRDQLVLLHCTSCGKEWPAKAFERCRGCTKKSPVEKKARGYVSWIETEECSQKGGSGE